MWPGFKLHDPARQGRGYRSPRCPGCLQLPERCICRLLFPRPCRVGVVVVMHAGEASRPTNSGRLAVQSLANARCVVRGLPRVPSELGPLDPSTSALLFPREDARPLSEADRHGPIRTLIVPDGTWGQTRRIVKRQPPLSSLPAVTLPEVAPSAYALRTAPDAGKLCTLEAIAHALALLDSETLRDALLDVLQAMVDAGLYRRGLLPAERAPDDRP